MVGEASSLNFKDNWYATSDLVDIHTKNPLTFKFISRKNEMINTGGYKVNPNEVEEAIRLNEAVNDVYVYGRKNSLIGNIISCDVVRNNLSLTDKEIRNFLKDKMQGYKIPRIINFVDLLTTTRTGKQLRNLK